VPDPLECLRVVTAGAGGVPDDARVEATVDRDLGTQVDVLRAAVIRVAPQLVDGKPEAGVPLDRAAQAARRAFHRGAAVARV
jgi:hypothetical protein